jgi:hypothetical protein
MLLKLHRRGLIELPPRQRSSFNHRRGASFQPVLHDTQPIEGVLSSLKPLRLVVADAGPQKDLWLTLLKGYHYLGLSTRVGKNIAYLALDALDRPHDGFPPTGKANTDMNSYYWRPLSSRTVLRAPATKPPTGSGSAKPPGAPAMIVPTP